MPSSQIAESRTAVLAERIRARIQAEQLNEGDFFMTEAQLAKEFGASRNMTREAVSQLRELGILEGRKRKGLVVRRPDPVQLLGRALPSVASSEVDIHKLAELRYVLEAGAIELAVTRATAEQIEQLEVQAKQYEEEVRKGVDVTREHELEVAFHGLILEMSGAELVSGMQQLLARFCVRAYPEPTSPELIEENIWQHHALVAAIRARDIERARVMIRMHFEGLLQPNAPPLRQPIDAEK